MIGVQWLNLDRYLKRRTYLILCVYTVVISNYSVIHVCYSMAVLLFAGLLLMCF